MSNLGIFSLEFEKAIIIFEIGTLKIFHGQSFMQMLCLGIFGLEFEKVIVIYEISTLKVMQKKKSSNLGPKKTYSKLYANKFLTFGVIKTDLGICGLEFENAIVIFEISTLKIV